MTMPSTHELASPRWHRRKDARPAEILRSAFDTFVERGYAATRLEDIARRAGCTKGTIFLYYANKEELFKATVRELIEPVCARAELLAASHQGGAAELLEKLLRLRWEALFHSPLSGMAKLMFAEAANFPELTRFYHAEIVDRGHRLMVRVIEAGVASGEFRRVDAEAVARLAIAPLLLAAIWKHSFASVCACEVDTAAYFGTHLELVLRALVREPAGKETRDA